MKMNDDRDDDVIGSIPPAEDVPRAPSPVEPPSRDRKRRRSPGVTAGLMVLGGLVGAALAVLWGTGVFDRASEDSDVLPPEPPPVVEAANHVERVLFSPDPERPEVTPDIITAESPLVHCFYEHTRLPADAKLRARWWLAGEELGELELLDQVSSEDSPDHLLGRFTIPAPEGGFEAGVYEVALACAEGGVTWRGSFLALPRAAKVLEGGGPPDAPVRITDLQTALGSAEDGSPLDVASEFAADASRVHACFRYEGMSPGGVFVVRWHFEERELTAARAELTVAASSGWGDAWLERGGEGLFARGEYRVTVHLGEEERPLASVGFVVVDAPDE